MKDMVMIVINYVLNIYFCYFCVYLIEINIFLRDVFVIILCLNMDEIEKYWCFIGYYWVLNFFICIFIVYNVDMWR